MPNGAARTGPRIPLPQHSFHIWRTSCLHSISKGLLSPRAFMNLAEWIDSTRDQHLAELYEFLRIPSISAKSEHKPDIERVLSIHSARFIKALGDSSPFEMECKQLV